MITRPKQFLWLVIDFTIFILRKLFLCLNIGTKLDWIPQSLNCYKRVSFTLNIGSKMGWRPPTEEELPICMFQGGEKDSSFDRTAIDHFMPQFWFCDFVHHFDDYDFLYYNSSEAFKQEMRQTLTDQQWPDWIVKNGWGDDLWVI